MFATRGPDAVGLEPRWSLVHGTPVFHRAREVPGCATVVLHLHGFAISGAYMVPTAALLADEFTTYVPDLPGFGRSPRPDRPLDIPGLADAAAGFLDAVGVERAVVVGNSLGCAVLAAMAEQHPGRVERAVTVSPAGGRHNQPLPRAVVQLARDAPREPLSMAAVAVPDYLGFGVVPSLRLFAAMTRFPAYDRMVAFGGPMLAVLGARDPLLPDVDRLREVVARMHADLTLAVIRDAAHAVNYSHPRELAALVRDFARGRALSSALAPPDGLSPVAVIRR